ncbi:hypothetical protein C0J52_18524 [Blattella germanica]|nr:hypothetical protein C0J52_18524 [Blattella germanica]
MPNDKLERKRFAETMLDKVDDDDSLLTRVCFSDEATVHVSGKVNKHNCRIWGFKNPRDVIEHQRDSPKLNVWCRIVRDRSLVPITRPNAT